MNIDRRVYFVQPAGGGPIKIGVTNDVENRLRTLRCGSPVTLRLVMDVAGDSDMEARLHRELAGHRLHGEWFADHPDVHSAVIRCFCDEAIRYAKTLEVDERREFCAALRAAAERLLSIEDDHSKEAELLVKSAAWAYVSAVLNSDEERRNREALALAIERRPA